MNGSAVATVGDNTIDRYVGGAVHVGGNAVNVAVQLRLLGIAAGYFGAIGDDENGKTVATVLEHVGVETEGVVIAKGATALTEIALTADGDRVFMSEEFGVTADYFPSHDELEAIAMHRWVHIGMLPRSRELVASLRSRNPGIAISQDCAVAAGYAGLDVAFCSAGESKAAADDLARDAVSGGARLAVITRGPAGVLAFDGNTYWEREAVPVEVVDTTGAGDSFIAGFVAARLSGGAVSSCLDAGAAAAARTCGHVAGFPQ